jgi:hypothetical protein
LSPRNDVNTERRFADRAKIPALHPYRLGRLDDAIGSGRVGALAGWRWPLVAIGLVALNRAAWDALSWSTYGADGVQRLQLSAFLTAGVPCAALFGLAAIPRLPRSRAATT